jgi:putative molybdopterin biosynthesis protein
VIRSLGDLIFHGVAVRPGKPVMLGRVGNKPVLGLPGYPLAAQTVLREFAAPLLESWGFAPVPKYPVTAKLAQPLVSDIGFDEFVPVFVGRIGNAIIGTPHGKGAAVQMATVKANGYTHIPAPLEGIDAGTDLEVFLTTDPESIERMVFLTGTLDPALEELAKLSHDDGLYLHATNPGNLSGFLALRSNTCHAAPISLPSHSLTRTCQPLIACSEGLDLTFIHVASTELGIASNDPFEIPDLLHARFINTKKGTPARIAFDALLAEEGIESARIDGYLQEVHGPPAVAAAIRNGFADAGMSTSSIASANGLRFVPVAHEDYELAVRRDMLEDSRIRTIVSIIKSSRFRKILEEMGGYNVSLTGTIRSLDNENALIPLSPGNLPAGYI